MVSEADALDGLTMLVCSTIAGMRPLIPWVRKVFLPLFHHARKEEEVRCGPGPVGGGSGGGLSHVLPGDVCPVAA